MPMIATTGTTSILVQDIHEVGRGVQSPLAANPPLTLCIHPLAYTPPLRTTTNVGQIVIEGISPAICSPVEWSQSASSEIRFHSPIIPPLVAKVPIRLLEMPSIRLVRGLPTAPVEVALHTSLVTSALHSPRRHFTPSRAYSPPAVRRLVPPVLEETQFEDLVRGLRMGNLFAHARAAVNLGDTRTDGAWRSGVLVRMGPVQCAIGAERR